MKPCKAPKNQDTAMRRALTASVDSIDTEARTVRASVSSDSADCQPSYVYYCDEWYLGRVILDHSSMESIDLTRFGGENGGPALYNHDADKLVGRFIPDAIEETDGVRKLAGVFRFSADPESDSIWQKVASKTLLDTSIRATWQTEDLELVSGDKIPVFRAKRWMPIEASLVSMAADVNTGVGRALVADPEPAAEKDQLTRSDSAAITPEVHMDTNHGPSPETVETDNLMAIARKYNISEETAKDNLAVGGAEALRSLIRSAMPTPSVVTQRQADPQITQKYSLSRALRTLTEGGNCLEKEIAQDIARSMPSQYQSRGGLLIPYEVLRAIGLGTGLDHVTATAGSEFLNTVQGPAIDPLRPQSLLEKYGAQQLLGLAGACTMPQLKNDPEARWEEDIPHFGTASSVTTGSIKLTPRALTSQVPVSRNLVAASSPAIDQVLARSFSKSLALAKDSDALVKILAAVPAGNTVTFPGTFDASKIYGLLVDLLAAPSYANAMAENIALACAPQVASLLLKTLDFTTSSVGKAIWQGNVQDGNVVGYNATGVALPKLAATNNVYPLIAGDWSTVVVAGFGGGIEVVADSISQVGSAQVLYTAIELADTGVTQPSAFSKSAGFKLA